MGGPLGEAMAIYLFPGSIREHSVFAARGFWEREGGSGMNGFIGFLPGEVEGY